MSSCSVLTSPQACTMRLPSQCCLPCLATQLSKQCARPAYAALLLHSNQLLLWCRA